MADKWFYSQNGQHFGPVSKQQVQELLSTNQLQTTDLVWSKGMAAWSPADSVPGLVPSNLNDGGSASEEMPPPLPTADELASLQAKIDQFFDSDDEDEASAEETADWNLHMKAEQNNYYANLKLNECHIHLAFNKGFNTRVAKEGLEFIEESLRINPKSSVYWNTKGLLLGDGLGDYQSGISCIQKALELEPDSIQQKNRI